jgi:hypothetical protein
MGRPSLFFRLIRGRNRRIFRYPTRSFHGLSGRPSQAGLRDRFSHFHDLLRYPPHRSVFTLPDNLTPWFQDIVKHKLFTIAFSTYQQATQEIMLPALRASFCDANAVEFGLSKGFLNILDEMMDSLTLDNLEKFLDLFQNHFYETTNAGRGTDQGICPDISSPQITVPDVLTRVPRQLWLTMAPTSTTSMPEPILWCLGEQC